MSKVDIEGVDLNLLKLLDALLKARSVTRAGQRIGLSQPAASRGLARLRTLFDDALLVRSTKGWELTPRAMALSESVATLLDDAYAIVSPIEFEPEKASGAFTIASGDHMAFLLMPELIPRLSSAAPGIDLIIPASSGDNVELIAQGGADLAVGVFETLPTRFYCRPLYDDDFVCVVRKDHPDISDSLTLKCYSSLSHLSVIISGQGRSTVDDALAQKGIKRRVVMKLPHFLVAPMVVAKSDLILTLPRRLAKKMVKLAPIKMLELPIDVKRFSPSLIWHGRQHKDPSHMWLRQLITEISSEL